MTKDCHQKFYESSVILGWLKKAQKSNACSRLFIHIPFFVSFLFMLLRYYCSKCNCNLRYSIRHLIESPPATTCVTVTFPRPGSSNFLGARFTQPHGSNIYVHIGFVSLGLLGPNKFLDGFTFPCRTFSKIYSRSFRSASQHQHISNYRIRFHWPSGTKQILRWVYFPSAWFLENLF